MKSSVSSLQSPVRLPQRSYRSLKVWEKATEFVLQIYEVTRHFPKEELYAMTNQLRRAAVSIASNIAEGSERRSDKDSIRFLRMARGSVAETETQLYLAPRLGYLHEPAYIQLLQITDEIGKMINGLSSGLESRERPTGDWRLETGD